MYRLGDRVRVQVIRVDMERRQIDLGLVGDARCRARQTPRRAPARTKARPKREGRRQRPGRRERVKTKGTRRKR